MTTSWQAPVKRALPGVAHARHLTSALCIRLVAQPLRERYQDHTPHDTKVRNAGLAGQAVT